MTTNPRKDYKNNCNARKVAPSYTQKDDSETNSRRIKTKLPYFPTQVKKMHVREIITSTASSRPKTLFHFYDANHLYLMTIALTRKNKNNNITPRYKSSTAKKTYPKSRN
jgi:hypothetical protein